MTLLEYVTSLQDTGLSEPEIFAKAQEWKKKNQSEVEEVIETPVEEVKTEVVAEEGVPAATTPVTPESSDSGSGSLPLEENNNFDYLYGDLDEKLKGKPDFAKSVQLKKDLFKPSEDIASLINFINPEVNVEDKPVEEKKLTRIENYIKNDLAPDSTFDGKIVVPKGNQLEIGDIDEKEALKDYKKRTGNVDGKIFLHKNVAKKAGFKEHLMQGKYDYIKYLKSDYYKQQAQKTVNLFEEPGFFNIPDQEILQKSAEDYFNLNDIKDRNSVEIFKYKSADGFKSQESPRFKNDEAYDKYLKTKLGNKYDSYVEYKKGNFEQTVDQKEISKTELLNAKIQRTILGSGGTETDASFALKYFSPTFVSAKNLQSDTEKLGDYITIQQKQIETKSEALNKVAKPVLEKLNTINGKIVNLLGKDGKLTEIGMFNSKSVFAKKELQEYTALREEYQIAYDKYLELDITNKASALEKEQFKTSYLVDVYNNKIKNLKDSGEKADLLSKSLSLDYSNSARISASLHDTFVKGTINFGNLVGQTVLIGIKSYTSDPMTMGVMDGVIHQMQRMNYNYNKGLAEERELTLPTALTLDDIGKDGISFFDYSAQALSDQSGTLVLSMIPFGAGAFGKAGSGFANLAARRSALLAQKNIGLFATNTVRTSFFAVESGSSFSDSITKKLEAIDKLDEFERKKAWGKLTPDDVQAMTTEKSNLERHKNFSFAQMAFNAYGYGTVATIAESAGTLKLPSILRKSAANYGARNLIKTATYKNPFQFAGWSAGKNIYRGLRPVITKAAPIEVLEETITAVGHNMLDYWTLGENKSFFEGINKDFLTKTLISTLAMTTPTTMGNIVTGIKGDFLTANEIQVNKKLRNELLNIEASLGTIGGKELQLAKKRKNEILNSFALNNASSIQKLNNLTPDQLFEISEINRQLRDLGAQANLIGKSGDTSVSNQNSLDNIKKEAEALKYVKDQLLETRSRKNKLKAKSLNEQLGTSANIDLEYTLGLNDFATDVAMVLMNPKGNYITIEDFTDSQAITQTLKDNGYSDAQIKNLLPKLTGDAPSNALQVGDDIIVNQSAIDLRMFTSSSSAAQYAAIAPIEEIFHANVNSKNLRKKKNKDGSYELDESATKAINDVVRILTDKKDQGIISEKDYNDLMSRFNLYKDGKGKVFLKSGERGAAGVDIEEVMAQINNAMVLGKIQRDDVKMMPSMRNFLNNTISSIMGDSSWLLNLDSAGDVINFMSNFQNRVQNRTLKINTVEEKDKTIKESKESQAKVSTKTTQKTNPAEVAAGYQVTPLAAFFVEDIKTGKKTNEKLIVEAAPKNNATPENRIAAQDALLEANWPVISNSIKFDPTGKIPQPFIKLAIQEMFRDTFPGRGVKAKFFDKFNPKLENKVTTFIDSQLNMRIGDILERAKLIQSEKQDLGLEKAEGKFDESTTQQPIKDSKLGKLPSKTTKYKAEAVENLKLTPKKGQSDKDAIEERISEVVTEAFEGKEINKFKETANIPRPLAKLYADMFGITTASGIKALRVKAHNFTKNESSGITRARQFLIENAAADFARIPRTKDDFEKAGRVGGTGIYQTKLGKGLYNKNGKLTGSLKNYIDIISGKNVTFNGIEFNALKNGKKLPIYRRAQHIKAALDFHIRNRAIETLQPTQSKRIKGGAKFSLGETFSNDEIAILKKLSTARDKNALGKLLDFKTTTINEETRAGLVANMLAAFKNPKYNLSIMILQAAKAESGGIQSFYGNVIKGKFVKKAKEQGGKKYIKTTDGKYILEKNRVSSGFKNWVPRPGKLFYGQSDPNYQDIVKVARKYDGPKFQKISIPRGKNQNKVLGETWKEEQIEKEKNNKIVRRDFVNELAEAHKKGLSLDIIGSLVIQSYQATSGLIKVSASFDYVSKVLGYGTGRKQGPPGGVNTYREEHNPPASVAGASIMFAIKYNKIHPEKGIIKLTNDALDTNYYQTQLAKFDDQKLDQAKLDATLPEGFTIFDNPIVRFAAAGIDLNTIINISTGKTIAETFNAGIPAVIYDAYNANEKLEASAYQNEQVIKAIKDPNYSPKKNIKVFQKLVPGKSTAAKLDSDLITDAIKYDEPITVQKAINALEKTDKALGNARKLNAPVKKIRVFDFDDTLAKSKSMVIVNMPDGSINQINATQFAKQASDLQLQGAEFDFSEFSKVVDGKKGPLFKVAKK